MPAISPDAMQWLSRTIAIVLLMIAPGLGGNWLDKRFDTSFWTAIGLGVGMLLSTTVFVIMSKAMIPKAGGRPLSDADFEDEVCEAGDDDVDDKDADADQPAALKQLRTKSKGESKDG